MRGISAIVAFIIALACGVSAIVMAANASRATSIEATGQLDGQAHYALIDGSVLVSHVGKQTLTLPDGDERYTVVVARDDDADGWLAGLPAQRLSLTDGEGETIASAAEDEGSRPVATETAQAPMPPLAGSDLWLSPGTEPAAGGSRVSLDVPANKAVIIANVDASKPLAGEITLEWPRDQRAPAVGPLSIVAIVFALIGLALLALAWRHAHRRRGPQRLQPDGTRAERGRRARRANESVTALAERHQLEDEAPVARERAAEDAKPPSPSSDSAVHASSEPAAVEPEADEPTADPVAEPALAETDDPVAVPSAELADEEAILPPTLHGAHRHPALEAEATTTQEEDRA